MLILSIDTSCDETAVAVTHGRKVLSNVIYSQIDIHKKWGGVVPSLAKRAHEERIDFVIGKSIKRFNNINCISVTQGPGLAVALEVGIRKAKELAQKYNKKIITVNHLEGHLYSCFVQNSQGNPDIPFCFPYLGLIISGGHTEIVKFTDHLKYEVIGQTIDDAAGEALDKAGKLLGLGYPGGAVIERLADKAGNQDLYHFPRPMMKSDDLNFSFSGLKTAFYYFFKKLSEKDKIDNLEKLASSFQEAVFDSLIKKTEDAIGKTGINNLVIGGGVIANKYLRNKFRQLVRKHNGKVLFPPYKYLTGDNAAMIGVVGHFKAEKGIFVKDVSLLDRIPRLLL